MRRGGTEIITEGFHHWIYVVSAIVAAILAGFVVFARTSPAPSPNVPDWYPPGASVEIRSEPYTLVTIHVEDEAFFDSDMEIFSAIYSFVEFESNHPMSPGRTHVRYIIEVRFPERTAAEGDIIQYVFVDGGTVATRFYDLIYYAPSDTTLRGLEIDRSFVNVTPDHVRDLAHGRLTVDDLTPGEPRHHLY